MRPTVRRLTRLVGVVTLAAALLVGCVPARTPPQLGFTPGPPLRLDAARVYTPDFSAETPPGWRVITAPAHSPGAVTFAAPDDMALIHLTGRPESPPLLPGASPDAQVIETTTIMLPDGPPVHVHLVAVRPTAYADAAAAVRASLRTPHDTP